MTDNYFSLGGIAGYPYGFDAPENNRPLRVAAYIRVSTDHENQEDSYEIQHDYFMELLAVHPLWSSAGIYSDYGVSGTSVEQRRGFCRLLRHCREGRIDRIVTKSISRFARNTRDFLKALEILKEHHVTIFFEKEHIDTAMVQSDWMMTIFGAVAQEESQSIAANIRQGMQHRYPRGEVRNVVIYGYRYASGQDSMEVMESGYSRKRIEIVETEAEVVRRIFTEAAEGKNCTEIARGLNYAGIAKPESAVSIMRSRMEETPVGVLHPWIEEGWTDRHVSQILQQERYCGDVLLQKTFTPDYKTHKSMRNHGELPQYYIEDNHPAIISRELFQKVRDMNGSKAVVRRRRVSYPFSGRLVCVHCGRFYITRNRKRRAIWICASAGKHNGKAICHAEKIYEEQLILVCRKAVAERFDINCGTFGAEGSSQSWGYAEGSEGMVQDLLRRMEQIQCADEMERDLTFLEDQIARLNDQIDADEQRLQRAAAAGDVAQMRKEILNEEISENLLHDLAVQWGEINQRLEKEQSMIRTLELQKYKLEQYWRDLESDYEWRRKAMEWIKTLPGGHAGVVEFLNGLTSEYAKAFILYMEVVSPFQYRIRWFDDTWTEVYMYSNVE